MTEKNPNYAREAEKYDNPIPSREFILEHINKSETKLTFNQLIEGLGLVADQDIYALKKRVRAMVRDGQLQQDKRSRYFIAQASAAFAGTVIGHRDGYGFVSPDDGEDDYYLNSHEMRGVFPGDRVLVRVVGTDRKGNHEVTIVEVIERSVTQVIGRVVIENNKLFVHPHNKNINQDIYITDQIQGSHKIGDVVVVKITDQPTRFAMPRGEITEKLGDYLTPGLEIEIAIRSHSLPHIFSEAVEESLKKIPDRVMESDCEGRQDFRDLAFVTIDGEDAKDFDDAVFCRPLDNGEFQLFVAIADVSHYVVSKTALDDEAFMRGNSVYFPGRVIPMLPEKLSNNLCSLNPKVDRLVLVCEMKISKEGKITHSEFHEGVIHSHARMTYNQVHEILQGNKVLVEEYQSLVEGFKHLHELYHVLNKRREARGAIEFETVETQILFNEKGKIREVVPRERNVAHKIIEECMLCANVSAAKYILKHKQGEVYRVHEGPSLEKLVELQKTLSKLGLHLNYGEVVQPADYAILLQKVMHRPDAKLLNTLMLRSLSQAIYSVEQQGHFGLAYEIYTHFTSPIRRYPDLLVHRIIRNILQKHKKRLYSDETLQQMSEHCSMTERRADNATRDAMDMLKCDFMQDKVGEDFDGIISGVTQFGFFVTLSQFYIEGLVHVSNLEGDFYVFDASTQSLRGERSGVTYRLGDEVKIRVARVNVDTRQIDFMIASHVAGKPSKAKQVKKSEKPKKTKKNKTKRKKRKSE